MKVKAGNSYINFTEELLPIEGFCGIHDLPKISVLEIEDEKKFVLVSMELVMLWDDFIESCKDEIARLLEVDKAYIWLHVTHAITTPHAPGGPMIGLGGDEVKLSKEESLKREKDIKKRGLYESTIMSALQQAISQMSPYSDAKVFIGAGEALYICGRDIQTKDGWWIGIDGDGESNPEMIIISFKDISSKNVAAVICYDMKPCVIDNAEMSKGARLMSADAPGLCCRKLEEEWGCPVLYLTGAAGDRIPVKTAWYDSVNLNGEVETVDLGVERGIEMATDLGEKLAEAAMDIMVKSEINIADGFSLKKGGFNWQTKKRVPMHPYNELTFEIEGTKNVDVEVLKLGSITLVAGRPEINTATETQLKETIANKHVVYVSMVNGGMKYMPNIEAYEQLRWEALASMLMPGAAEMFVKYAGQLSEL